MHDLFFTDIEEVVNEGKGFTTLRFRFPRRALAGQFVMVWLPGVDEIPMSLSYIEGLKGITVKDVGIATRALSSLREGDSIALRGPFGSHFIPSAGSNLIVSGGTGAASLMPAAESIGDRRRVDIAMGARTKDEVLFEGRARLCASDVRVSTDDGTYGCKGTAVELAQVMMKGKQYDMILACGPELMLKNLLDICKRDVTSCQFSLERYMKCGVGLCGSCALDGKRVCTDGPVFRSEELASFSEFGKWKRDESGVRIRL